MPISADTTHDRASATRNEIELLAEVLGGKSKAWEELQQLYQGLVRACVRRALLRYHAEHNSEDIDDLVADTWLILLQNDKARLRRFDPSRGTKLSSWIGLLTTNHVIDQLRRQRRHESLDELADLLQPRDTRLSPQRLLERRQEQALANAALASLTRDEQRFVTACFRDERSPARLAAELGISLNTVYSRKFKVRVKLSRLVAKLDRPVGRSIPSHALQ